VSRIVFSHEGENRGTSRSFPWSGFPLVFLARQSSDAKLS